MHIKVKYTWNEERCGCPICFWPHVLLRSCLIEEEVAAARQEVIPEDPPLAQLGKSSQPVSRSANAEEQLLQHSLAPR